MEIAEQKKAAARRAKEVIKPNYVVAEVIQKPDLVPQPSQGPEFSGQRKTYADRKCLLITAHRIATHVVCLAHDNYCIYHSLIPVRTLRSVQIN